MIMILSYCIEVISFLSILGSRNNDIVVGQYNEVIVKLLLRILHKVLIDLPNNRAQQTVTTFLLIRN